MHASDRVLGSSLMRKQGLRYLQGDTVYSSWRLKAELKSRFPSPFEFDLHMSSD
jgi:hypothetical protein